MCVATVVLLVVVNIATMLASGTLAVLTVGETFYGGFATYYGDGTQGADPAPIKPNYGACGYDAPADTRYFAALNQPMYNAHMSRWPSSVCGQCVRVSCADPYQCPGGVPTVFQIVDSCPGCKTSTSIDLSHIGMGDVVGGYDIATQIGVIAITWTVVACPEIYGPIHGGKYEDSTVATETNTVTTLTGTSTATSTTAAAALVTEMTNLTEQSNQSTSNDLRDISESLETMVAYESSDSNSTDNLTVTTTATISSVTRADTSSVSASESVLADDYNLPHFVGEAVNITDSEMGRSKDDNIMQKFSGASRPLICNIALLLPLFILM